MQIFGYLLDYLVKEIGYEAAFQVVDQAVSQNTSSEQVFQLYLAFSTVREHQKPREKVIKIMLKKRQKIGQCN